MLETTTNSPTAPANRFMQYGVTRKTKEKKWESGIDIEREKKKGEKEGGESGKKNTKKEGEKKCR